METFLDISNFDNQVFIALQMAEIFTTHELLQLQLNSIIVPETRDINDPFEIFFDKIFQSNNRIQLVDLITHINNRPERCMDLRIYKTNMIGIIIKCEFNTKFPIYVSDISCLAINYIKYGVPSTRSYNMTKLAETFTRIAAEMSKKGSIDNCNEMIEYLSLIIDDVDNDIYTSYHYLKQFNKGICSYTITIHNPQMLKFTLYNTDKRSTEYIFVPRNRIGLIILIDICQNIIKQYASMKTSEKF